MIEPKVAVDTLHEDGAGVESLAEVCRFRDTFYRCLGARADAQFELADALLCTEGPVRTLVDLSLAPEHRRGHGAPYDGLNQGTIEIARLRRCVAGLALPRVGDRIVLAVDVSPWLRPDAETSAQRLFCHVHGRAKGSSQMIPGWLDHPSIAGVITSPSRSCRRWQTSDGHGSRGTRGVRRPGSA